MKVDGQKAKFLSYIFSSCMKLMRGDQDFGDELDYMVKEAKS